LRTRKCRTSVLLVGGNLSFNGAASLRTRKFHRNLDWVRVHAALQWGRVVEDAEVTVRKAFNSCPAVLQWGRVVEDAEVGL